MTFGLAAPLQPGILTAKTFEFTSLLRDRIRINYQHHLALGLKMCLVPAGPGFVDLVNRGRWSKTTGGSTPGIRGLMTLSATAGAWTGSDAVAATTELDFSTGGWSLGAVVYSSALPAAFNQSLRHSAYTNESTNSGILIGVGSSNNISCVQIYNNSASASYRLNGGVSLCPAVTGCVYSIVATGDGTTVRLYTNGAADVNSTTMPQYPRTLVSTGSLILGAGGGDQPFIGCFWNRTLSAAEVMKFHLAPYAFLTVTGEELWPFGAGTYSTDYKTWQTR